MHGETGRPNITVQAAPKARTFHGDSFDRASSERPWHIVSAR